MAENGTHDSVEERLRHARAALELKQTEAKLRHISLLETRQKKLKESYEAWSWLSGYSDQLDRMGGPDRDLLLPVSTAMDRRYGDNWPFWRSWMEHARLRAASRLLYQVSPLVQGALHGLGAYVVGDGMQAKATARRDNVPEILLEAVQDFFGHFDSVNDWLTRQSELFVAGRIDGEWFLRMWPQDDGMTILREVLPEHVVEPPTYPIEIGKYGVLTDPEDLQDVRGYFLAYDGLAGNGEEVSSREVFHLKENVHRCVKRGLPDISYDSLDLYKVVGRLLENMGQGAAIQAAIAFVRQHATATPAQIADFISSTADYQTTQPFTGNSRSTMRYEAGTIVDMDAGQQFVESPFAANVGNFVQAVQALLRATAVKWNAPEWLVSADASNNNYSSSLTAESPFVKRCKQMQRRMSTTVHCIVERALQHYCRRRRGIRAGGKLYPWEILRQLVEIQITPATVETRDRQQEASLNQTYVTLGVKSRQTVAAEQGLDFDVEERNNEEYEKKHGEQGVPGELRAGEGGGGPDDPEAGPPDGGGSPPGGPGGDAPPDGGPEGGATSEQGMAGLLQSLTEQFVLDGLREHARLIEAKSTRKEGEEWESGGRWYRRVNGKTVRFSKADKKPAAPKAPRGKTPPAPTPKAPAAPKVKPEAVAKAQAMLADESIDAAGMVKRLTRLTKDEIVAIGKDLGLDDAKGVKAQLAAKVAELALAGRKKPEPEPESEPTPSPDVQGEQAPASTPAPVQGEPGPAGTSPAYGAAWAKALEAAKQTGGDNVVYQDAIRDLIDAANDGDLLTDLGKHMKAEGYKANYDSGAIAEMLQKAVEGKVDKRGAADRIGDEAIVTPRDPKAPPPEPVDLSRASKEELLALADKHDLGASGIRKFLGSRVKDVARNLAEGRPDKLHSHNVGTLFQGLILRDGEDHWDMAGNEENWKELAGLARMAWEKASPELKKELQRNVGDIMENPAVAHALGLNDKSAGEETGPKPPKPGFTGTDAQGREWVNGELVAAKEESPADDDSPFGEVDLADADSVPTPSPDDDPFGEVDLGDGPATSASPDPGEDDDDFFDLAGEDDSGTPKTYHEVISRALEKSNLSEEKKKAYHETMQKATRRMPEAAQKRLHAHLRSATFHGSTREIGLAQLDGLTATLGEEEAKRIREGIESGEIEAGGSFSSATGEIVLDGDHSGELADSGTAYGQTRDAEGIYAHELTHAIDGLYGYSGGVYSNSDEWQKAWKQEINHELKFRQRPRLNDYSRTSPAEGFAEFGRLLYGTDIPLAQIEKDFPGVSAFFKDKGLWPDPASRPEGEAVPLGDVFSERLDTDDKGSHLDVLKPEQEPEPEPEPPGGLTQKEKDALARGRAGANAAPTTPGSRRLAGADLSSLFGADVVGDVDAEGIDAARKAAEELTAPEKPAPAPEKAGTDYRKMSDADLRAALQKATGGTVGPMSRKAMIERLKLAEKKAAEQGAPKPPGTPTPPAALSDVASRTDEVYKRAVSFGATREEVDGLLKDLAGASKADLLRAAEKASVFGAARMSKEQIIGKIKENLYSGLGAAHRQNVIDAPYKESPTSKGEGDWYDHPLGKEPTAQEVYDDLGKYRSGFSLKDPWGLKAEVPPGVDADSVLRGIHAANAGSAGGASAPLQKAYEAARKEHPGLTVRQFHETLKAMQKEGKVYLGPFTRPPQEAIQSGEGAYHFVTDSEAKGYVSPTGKAPKDAPKSPDLRKVANDWGGRAGVEKGMDPAMAARVGEVADFLSRGQGHRIGKDVANQLLAFAAQEHWAGSPEGQQVAQSVIDAMMPALSPDVRKEVEARRSKLAAQAEKAPRAAAAPEDPDLGEKQYEWDRLQKIDDSELLKSELAVKRGPRPGQAATAPPKPSKPPKDMSSDEAGEWAAASPPGKRGGPDSPLRTALKQTFEDLSMLIEYKHDRLVDLPTLFNRAKAKVPNLTPEEFKQEVKAWWGDRSGKGHEGRAEMHIQNEVHKLRPDQRAMAIDDMPGTDGAAYYYMYLP